MQVEALRAKSGLGVGSRRAEPERVINNPHSRVARASERAASDDIPHHCRTQRLRRPAQLDALFSILTDKSPRPLQCKHYLPVTTDVD